MNFEIRRTYHDEAHCHVWQVTDWDDLITFIEPFLTEAEAVSYVADRLKKEKQMRTYFYYGRDINNRPIVTNCFVVDGEYYARGTTVCSDKDNPCKAYGRRKAFGRAMRAFYRRENRMAGGTAFWKGFFMPKLRQIEIKLMGRAK